MHWGKLAIATWTIAAQEAVHQFFIFVSSLGVSWVGQVVYALAKDEDKESSGFGTPVDGRRIKYRICFQTL